MKKLLFLLLLLPAIIFAQSKGFTIQGQLEGYPEGTTVRLVKNGENTDMATAQLRQSKFLLKGNVSEPVLCFLFIGDEQRPVEIYVENKMISFTGNKAKPGIFEIGGSPSHKEFDDFVKEFLPFAQQINTLGNQLNTMMPGPDRDSLMQSFLVAKQNVQNVIDKQVSQKPKSVVTAFLLSATYGFNEDVVLLEKRFNSLDAAVRTSETGKQLSDQIAAKKIGAIGTPALDFSQPDTTGTPVSLSSFRGKYVLVDFWASWCGPCRQENPTVVENFKKFKSKNFTVLGVSLDRPGQKEKWVEAIKKDNLTWTHVSDLQFWNNAAAKLYNIQGIPQNLLIDPNGIIVAKNLRGPALEAKLCEILGCN